MWFPVAVGDRTDGHVEAPPSTLPAPPRPGGGAEGGAVSRALAAGDERALDELAARVVAELGVLANAATTGSYSAQQTQALDTLAPRTAIASALARLQDAAEDSPGGKRRREWRLRRGRPRGRPDRPQAPGFASRFTRDELRSGVAAFRRRVEA